MGLKGHDVRTKTDKLIDAVEALVAEMRMLRQTKGFHAQDLVGQEVTIKVSPTNAMLTEKNRDEI